MISTCIYKGPNSTVIAARQRSSNIACAIKIISKGSLRDRASKAAVAREVSLLARLDHPNLVRFVDAFETAEAVFIATELCPHDLFSYVSRTSHGLSEREALLILKQLLAALEYMHERRVAHRDLKLENILLTHQDALSNGLTDAQIASYGSPSNCKLNKNSKLPLEPIVKLTDFGLSYWRAPDARELTTRQRSGTPFYASPEVLVVSERGYIPEQADMWSVGIILFAMLTRRLPFQGRTFAELRRNIFTFNVREFVHQQLRLSRGTATLLLALLNRNPSYRPTAREASLLATTALRQCSANRPA